MSALACYSDLEHLQYIKKLVNELGVNPAGVEVVFKMAKLMNEMQSRIQKLTDELEQARGQKGEVKRQTGKTADKEQR
jgi:coenzyme F420-reducing hydrogenase delta subunit